MGTDQREDHGMLDRMDTLLIRAIQGAAWFPLVFLPRMLRRAFPAVAKFLRVLLLLGVWMTLVFGPLAFLDDMRDPFPGLLILGWTGLTLVGSVAGVLRHRKAADRRRVHKPAGLSEVFA